MRIDRHRPGIAGRRTPAVVAVILRRAAFPRRRADTPVSTHSDLASFLHDAEAAADPRRDGSSTRRREELLSDKTDRILETEGIPFIRPRGHLTWEPAGMMGRTARPGILRYLDGRASRPPFDPDPLPPGPDASK